MTDSGALYSGRPSRLWALSRRKSRPAASGAKLPFMRRQHLGELRKDDAIAEADTLLLTVPNPPATTGRKMQCPYSRSSVYFSNARTIAAAPHHLAIQRWVLLERGAAPLVLPGKAVPRWRSIEPVI